MALYNQAAAQLEKSQANLKNAELELQKYNKLYKNNFVSDQDYQQVLAKYKVMQASLAEAMAALDTA